MKSKCALFMVALLVLITFLYSFSGVKLKIHKVATASTIKSFADCIRALDPLGELSQDWVMINDETYNAIVNSLPLASLDVTKENWNNRRELVDLWGNRFQVAFRRGGNNIYEIKVWSKGSDCLTGTNDDIVQLVAIPEEAEANQNKKGSGVK